MNQTILIISASLKLFKMSRFTFGAVPVTGEIMCARKVQKLGILIC